MAGALSAVDRAGGADLMAEGYGCDHAWTVDHVDTTSGEQDAHGRRIVRLTSTYWLCGKCGATNVTVRREEGGVTAHEGYES